MTVAMVPAIEKGSVRGAPVLNAASSASSVAVRSAAVATRIGRPPGERSSRPFWAIVSVASCHVTRAGLADGEGRELVPQLLTRVGHPAGRADEELVGKVGAGRDVVRLELVVEVGRDRHIIGRVERHDRDRDGRAP